MTEANHALVLIPPRTSYPTCPRYDELVVDWSVVLCLSAGLAVVMMLGAVALRRKAP